MARSTPNGPLLLEQFKARLGDLPDREERTSPEQPDPDPKKSGDRGERPRARLLAAVLFFGSLAPDMDRPATQETYPTVMTRDAPSTSRNLRLLAAGAMPPIEWGEVEDFLDAI